MCFIKDKGRENARPGRIFQRIGVSELTDAGGTLRCFEDVKGKYRSKKRWRWNLNRNRFAADAKVEVDAKAEAQANAEAETKAEAEAYIKA